MRRKSVTQMFALCATLFLLAPHTLFTQASVLEKPDSPSAVQPRGVFIPDAATLFRMLSSNAHSPSALNAAVEPVQDQDPPEIGFSPSALFLFPPPPPFPYDFGALRGLAVDFEPPFIVAIGQATAIGLSVCSVAYLDTYFQFFDIRLPSGEVALGIGYLADAGFFGYYSPYLVLTCGGLEIIASDVSGNIGVGFAPVTIISF